MVRTSAFIGGALCEQTHSNQLSKWPHPLLQTHPWLLISDMQATPFSPKTVPEDLRQGDWACARSNMEIHYLFWFAVNATYSRSPSYSPSGGHTRCLDYRALLFWAQQGGLFKQGDYRVLGVAGFGPARLPTPASAAPLTRLNYKAFICHTTRPLLDVVPHVSLCVACSPVHLTILKLQLQHLVVCAGHFSRVITSCVMCSAASGNYSEASESGIDIWTHERETLEDAVNILRIII